MEEPNVNVGTIEAPQTSTVNMRGKMREEIAQEETSPKLNEELKEALTNPMETVGRSMVNFKGIQHLSVKDLNYLAPKIVRNNATANEVSLLKEALVMTMNKLGKNNMQELRGLCKDTESCLDMLEVFEDYVVKINPNANVEKIVNMCIGIL